MIAHVTGSLTAREPLSAALAHEGPNPDAAAAAAALRNTLRRTLRLRPEPTVPLNLEPTAPLNLIASPCPRCCRCLRAA